MGAAIAVGELYDKAMEEAGEEAAFLFETHQMMAEDLDYEESIQNAINDKLNAEAAVSDTAAQFAEMFAAMDDAYFQARAADVKDVSGRILGILTGAVSGGVDSPVPVILAADDLAPSETVQLDKSKILGFITEGGSGSSHTAILARTMGIPAIIGVGSALKPEMAGHEVIIDGSNGNILIDADEASRVKMLKKMEEQKKMQALDLKTVEAINSGNVKGAVAGGAASAAIGGIQSTEAGQVVQGFAQGGWIGGLVAAVQALVSALVTAVGQLENGGKVLNFIMNGNATADDQMLFDINEDGELNIGDAILVVKNILESDDKEAERK